MSRAASAEFFDFAKDAGLDRSIEFDVAFHRGVSARSTEHGAQRVTLPEVVLTKRLEVAGNGDGA